MRDGEEQDGEYRPRISTSMGEGDHACLTTAISVDEDAEAALIPLHDEKDRRL